MIRVEKYTKSYENSWNDFVNNSKNGVFLFNRDYMEYHSDRFHDYSLMFFNGNNLMGLMPANIENNTVYSHGGLTMGGILSNNKMNASKMLMIFEALKQFLKDNGIEKLVYKAIPYIYHTIPADEDLYALFRNDAKLIRRDASSCIYKDERIGFNRQKRRNIKRCRNLGVTVERSYDFDNYMEIKEEDLLKKYGIKPVHNGEEIKLLADRFPENIKLFTVAENGEMVAGIIIYESKNVAHGQYLAATDYGKEIYAADLITDFLVNEYYKNKCYDYGISTEDSGRYLNKGLILFKEGFGARTINYDFYEMII